MKLITRTEQDLADALQEDTDLLGYYDHVMACIAKFGFDSDQARQAWEDFKEQAYYKADYYTTTPIEYEEECMEGVSYD